MKISEEEYLKAKAIVDQYEREDYEEKQRQADWSLEEDDPEDDDDDDYNPRECDFCGRLHGKHTNDCIHYEEEY